MLKGEKGNVEGNMEGTWKRTWREGIRAWIDVSLVLFPDYYRVIQY